MKKVGGIQAQNRNWQGESKGKLEAEEKLNAK